MRGWDLFSYYISKIYGKNFLPVLLKKILLGDYQERSLTIIQKSLQV